MTYELILKKGFKTLDRVKMETSQTEAIKSSMEWYNDKASYYIDNKINHKFILKDVDQNKVILKITTRYL